MPIPEPQTTSWTIAGGRISLDRPIVVAILNITPDSFSDGGRYFKTDEAVIRAEQAIAEGADVLDLGGESTRPGAQRVSVAEEMERVLPVLKDVRKRHIAFPISVDTTRAQVARAVLDEGASVINDVSALRLDPEIALAVASARAGIVLMHSRGTVAEMASYELARYGDDVIADVMSDLREAVARALDAGIPTESLVLDPGIGFSKRSEHSIAVLRGLDRLVGMGFPIMVGASRKRVIGELTNTATPAERRDGTIGAHVAALARGARLFRVHDVLAHRHALDAAWRILH